MTRLRPSRPGSPLGARWPPPMARSKASAADDLRGSGSLKAVAPPCPASAARTEPEILRPRLQSAPGGGAPTAGEFGRRLGPGKKPSPQIGPPAKFSGSR